jgi:hypothetical protein
MPCILAFTERAALLRRIMEPHRWSFIPAWSYCCLHLLIKLHNGRSDLQQGRFSFIFPILSTGSEFEISEKSDRP